MIFSSSVTHFSLSFALVVSMPYNRWTLENPVQGTAFHELVVLPTVAPHLARPYVVPGAAATDSMLFHLLTCLALSNPLQLQILTGLWSPCLLQSPFLLPKSQKMSIPTTFVRDFHLAVIFLDIDYFEVNSREFFVLVTCPKSR